MADPASRDSCGRANARATRALRDLALRAKVPSAALRTFYDGRHTGQPVKAGGFSDILRFQGHWANSDGAMGVYVVPPLATAAAKLRECFRELDSRASRPPPAK